MGVLKYLLWIQRGGGRGGLLGVGGGLGLEEISGRGREGRARRGASGTGIAIDGFTLQLEGRTVTQHERMKQLHTRLHMNAH